MSKVDVVGHFLPQYGTSTGTGSAVKALIDATSAAGLPVVVYKHGPADSEEIEGAVRIVSFKKGKLLPIPVRVISRLRANLDGLSVIHFHQPFTIRQLTLWLLIRIPFVYVPHGCFHPYTLNRRGKRFKKWLYSLLIERRIVCSAIAVLCGTEAERRDAQRYMGNDHVSELLTVPFPYSPPATGEPLLDRRATRVALGLPEQAFVVSFLGRWDVEVKGLDLLVTAVDCARKMTGADIRVMFLGFETHSQRPLERLVRAQGAHHFCHLVGPVYGLDKFASLQASDMYCQPSRCESFGVSMVEALAIGLPVLVSCGASLSLDLTNARAAETFNGSAADLTMKVLDLWQDPARRMALSKAGQRFVRSTLAHPVASQNLLRAYNQIGDIVRRRST